ncbi:MAG: DNA starvation/stationary phase protection protein [Sulfurovum sp.]|jgi:starvation-inducible DNA-binding protein|uniref:Dps family protein n=1 Tax=Sulfurovum sp. TaxID=1969726 RepID=UPI003C76FC19
MSKVTKNLKQLQADAHALFVKIHNYHWNVKGMDFEPVHLKTEEIYNTMSTLYDDAAERVIQLGGKPYLTLDDLAKATNIKTEKGDTFKSKEVVKNIITDYKYLHKLFQELSDDADNANDKTTAAFADDNVAVLEKELWMLDSMIK